jgi:hypothetical protein
MKDLRANAATAEVGRSALVKTLVQFAVSWFWIRPRHGHWLDGSSSGCRFQAEGNKLIKDLIAWMECWDPCHGGEGQGDPLALCLISKLNPVIAVAKGDREIPLRAVAINRYFLKGVGVG